VHTIAPCLQLTCLHEVLGVFVEQWKRRRRALRGADLERMLTLAEQPDDCATRLSLKELFICAAAPVETSVCHDYIGKRWARIAGVFTARASRSFRSPPKVSL
jgi:hypothetical protein